MSHETYKLTALDKDVRYLYFPRGRDHDYHEMQCTKPLHLGENGYNETDIRVRGLALLEINYERLHRLHLNDLEVLTPIYVVQREHFLNKSIRFREGQKYIFGTMNPIGAEIFIVSNFSEFIVDGKDISIFLLIERSVCIDRLYLF